MQARYQATLQPEQVKGHKDPRLEPTQVIFPAGVGVPAPSDYSSGETNMFVLAPDPIARRGAQCLQGR